MRNFARKFLSFLLALTLILGCLPFSVSNANSNTKDPISLEKNVQTEESAKDLLKSYQDLSNLDDKLLKSAQPDENEEVRVIVEVEGDPLVLSATAKDQKVSDMVASQLASQEKALLEKQAFVKSTIDASGIKAEYLSEYTAIVNAFSAKVKWGDLEKLEDIPGVLNVQVSNEYERPEPVMFTSNDQINAGRAWELNYTGENTIIAVLDTGTDPKHKDLVMDEDAKLALNKDEVEKLIQTKGLPGKYYSDKVVYAYNYYDLNHVVQDTGSSQHGMHVAGTAVANGKKEDGGIKGVAPRSQLASMKVFSNDMRYATTFSDIYVKAIDDAVKLGADVVNLSLGSPAGFRADNDIEQKALANARENGIVVSISAGNERNIVKGGAKFGAEKALEENTDTGLIGSPSVNLGATTVASFENTHIMSAVAKTNHIPSGLEKGQSKALEQILLVEANGAPKFSSLSDKEWEFVFVGTGKAEEFDKVDVKGKIAIAIRGNTFTDTIKNGNKAGAAGVLVYNNETGGEGTVNMAGGDIAEIPFAFVKHSSGNSLKKAQELDPTVRLTFAAELESTPSDMGNHMSDFSSWGPTPDLRLKPEILAPGGEIYSTQNGNSYATMSGTSMAAPHVAGGIAVVRQYVEEKIKEGVFPEMTNEDLSNFIELLLMNTARVVSEPGNPEHIYSPRQQGAGLMDLHAATNSVVTVHDAYHSRTSKGKGKLELGQVGNSSSVVLEFNNYGEKDLILTPRIAVVQEVVSEGRLQERTEVIKRNIGKQVDLPARGKALGNLKLDFSSVRNNSFAEGFIEFVDQEGAIVASVPFLGFKGRWDEARVIDTMNGFNLLANPNPDNMDDFSDIDAGQESQFKASGFYQSGMFGGRVMNPNKLLLAPDNSVYNLLLGTGSITPIISQLRNAKHMEYQLVDNDGNLLRTIHKEDEVRKIFRLYAGRVPFRLVGPAKFDGKVNGKKLDDGSYTYRIVSLVDFKNAKAQHDDFHLVIDNKGPVFEKNENGQLVYQYNPETLELKIKVMDFKKDDQTQNDVAGLDIVSVKNVTTNKTINYSTEDGVLVDKDKQIYEFTIDLSKHITPGKKEVLEIKAVDNIFNESADKIVFNRPGTPEAIVKDETIPNVYLDEPSLLTVLGDKNPESKDVLEVKVSGFVWGWDNLDKVSFADEEIPFIAKKIEVKDGKEEVYSGEGFEFNGHVELGEGYHEIELKVSSEHKKDFGIGRRFWIDLTKPKVKGPATIYTNSSEANVEFRVIDNLHLIEVKREDNYITKIDTSGKQGFSGKVDEVVTDKLTNLSEGIQKFNYSVKDHIYTTNYTVYVVRGQGLNIDELVELLSKAKSINSDNYIEETVNELEQAIQQAEEVLAKGLPSQEEVDKVSEKLKQALSKLEEPVSEEEKEPLRELLEKAKTVDKTLYTPISVEVLETAIKNAEDLLAKEKVSRRELADAQEKLQNALDNLVELDPKFLPATQESLNELKQLVEKAESVDRKLYTKESLKTLDLAKSNAEEILDKEKPLSGEVEKAKESLQSALDGLEKRDLTPNIEGKDAKIRVGEEIDLLSLFTAKDIDGNPLEVILDGTVDNKKVGKYVVTGTVEDNGFESSAKVNVKVVENDKTKLNDKIEKVESIKLSDYTKESIEALQKLLIIAKRVSSNENALVEEIDKVIVDLEQAIEDLEVISKGWKTVDGKKYYLVDGKPKTGWFTVEGDWYFANKQGVVQTGWLKQVFKTYYLEEDGKMAVGWRTINGHKYYFKESGVMAKSFLRIDGQTHYFSIINGRWIRRVW